MNSEVDYYAVLGVLPDAEDIVVVAAYRALANRYHPDRWKGDVAEATRRMADINIAYGVLGDVAKRKDAVIALNKCVDVLGTGIDPARVIAKVRADYNVPGVPTSSRRATRSHRDIEAMRSRLRWSRDYRDACKLASARGYDVVFSSGTLFSPSYWDVVNQVTNSNKLSR